MSSIIRQRSGLTADVALAMGWSPDQRLVSATKPSHQEAISANSDAHPASAVRSILCDSLINDDAVTQKVQEARITAVMRKLIEMANALVKADRMWTPKTA